MSAAVIPFTRKPVGHVFERSDHQQRHDDKALRDARLIREARAEEDTWLSTAFLALVRVLDKDQQRTLETMLSARATTSGDEAAEQAAAVVRFATGKPEHVGRVADMLSRMGGVQ